LLFLILSANIRYRRISNFNIDFILKEEEEEEEEEENKAKRSLSS